uniref:translation initiation factor IF-2-like n=1 Tax=Ictidomys tridecemlineatus TaxID=43179 RepID=UPI001A9DCF6B|nr:translation initiation factor IF-2-like [Ictidomys tridecemlineatus]
MHRLVLAGGTAQNPTARAAASCLPTRGSCRPPAPRQPQRRDGDTENPSSSLARNLAFQVVDCHQLSQCLTSRSFEAPTSPKIPAEGTTKSLTLPGPAPPRPAVVSFSFQTRLGLPTSRRPTLDVLPGAGRGLVAGARLRSGQPSFQLAPAQVEGAPWAARPRPDPGLGSWVTSRKALFSGVPPGSPPACAHSSFPTGLVALFRFLSSTLLCYPPPEHARPPAPGGTRGRGLPGGSRGSRARRFLRAGPRWRPTRSRGQRGGRCTQVARPGRGPRRGSGRRRSSPPGPSNPPHLSDRSC